MSCHHQQERMDISRRSLRSRRCRLRGLWVCFTLIGEEIGTNGFAGKMSMTIPPFVKLEHDAATRKAFVTIEDKEVKKQREMWGMASTNIL